MRLPGSLLLEPEAERLEVLEAAEDPNSALARSLGIRQAVRVAQVRMDTDSRVRQALLPQSTPTRGPCPVGLYVYFYRQQAPPGTGRVYKWHGPARVIGVELRNQRRLEDQDLPTQGGQPHSYWLRLGNSVALVTGEQLRFASEEELLAAHSVPQEILAPPYARGARSYVDLRAQPLAAPPAEEQDARPRQRPRVSGSIPPVPASALVPGTDIPVVHELLPPLPEADDGGLLNEIGQQQVPQEPPQIPRTGEGASASVGPGQQQVHEEQAQIPGEGAPIDRQHSRMSTEPEPHPTPPLSTSSSSTTCTTSSGSASSASA